MRFFMINNYTISDTCITVYDSYKVSKKEFDPFFNELRKNDEYRDFAILQNRTNKSMSDEWACHNLIYNIDICGLFRSHTKDVDMQYPLTWWEKIVYPMFGWLAKIFIK